MVIYLRECTWQMAAGCEIRTCVGSSQEGNVTRRYKPMLRREMWCVPHVAGAIQRYADSSEVCEQYLHFLLA